MKYWLVILFITVFFSSSAYAGELNLNEFQKTIDMLHSHAWFKGYFYTGSDGTYHHFIEKWDYKIDPEFKISKSKLNIANEFKLGEKEVAFSLFKNESGRYLFKIGDKVYYLWE